MFALRSRSVQQFKAFKRGYCNLDIAAASFSGFQAAELLLTDAVRIYDDYRTPKQTHAVVEQMKKSAL